MKSMVIYILLFLAAFVLTSAAIIYLNRIYLNVFAFDFRPEGAQTVSSPDTSASSGKIAVATKTYTPVKKDSTVNTQEDSGRLSDVLTVDSLNSAALSRISDSTRILKTDLNKTRNSSLTQTEKLRNESEIKNTLPGNKPDTVSGMTAETQTDNGRLKTVLNLPHDSLYNAWMKSTAKLYENMDPKKAAKILSNYSDNMARDIIYTMKKKKAAEILTELNPEFASRITRMK